MIKAFGGKAGNQKKWEAKGDSKGYNAGADFKDDGAGYKRQKL